MKVAVRPKIHFSDWSDRLSRRGTLIGLASVLALIVSPSKANANAEEIAVEVVKFTINRLKDLADHSTTEEDLISNLEKVIKETTDVQAIGGIALGPAWRRATDQQRRDFIKVYQAYLARKYFEKFSIFIYGQFELVSVRTVKEDTIFDVLTVNHYEREAPFTVRWRVAKRNGKTRVYNIILDGINMLAIEQRIIKGELKKRKGDLDRLIADIDFANETAFSG